MADPSDAAAPPPPPATSAAFGRLAEPTGSAHGWRKPAGRRGRGAGGDKSIRKEEGGNSA